MTSHNLRAAHHNNGAGNGTQGISSSEPILGIVSLNFGILSFLVLFLPGLPFVFSLVAIILGVIGIKSRKGRGMCIAGITLGALAICFITFIPGLILQMLGITEKSFQFDM